MSFLDPRKFSSIFCAALLRFFSAMLSVVFFFNFVFSVVCAVSFSYLLYQSCSCSGNLHKQPWLCLHSLTYPLSSLYISHRKSVYLFFSIYRHNCFDYESYHKVLDFTWKIKSATWHCSYAHFFLAHNIYFMLWLQKMVYPDPNNPASLSILNFHSLLRNYIRSNK